MPQQNPPSVARFGTALSSIRADPGSRARSVSERASFVKACRHKGRWINVGICFGIDLNDIFKLGIRADRRNLVVRDDDDVYNMYVFCANLIWHHTSFFREEGEKDLILSAYSAILNLIPKLKKMLPTKDDADREYFNKIVNAVRSAHTPCRAMTYVV